MQHKFNRFITFELSEEEQEVGRKLHPVQIANLQNIRADIAETILNVRFDPLNPLSFGLARAELTGQLNILDYVIALSDAVDPSKVTKPTVATQGE